MGIPEKLNTLLDTTGRIGLHGRGRMAEHKEPVVFLDAAAPDEGSGGKLGLVAKVMAGLGLLVLAWVVVSLQQLQKEVADLKSTNARVSEMRAEMANLTEVSATAQKDLRSVKRLLSGAWHQYDAGSLEALKFIGEMSAEDKKDFLAALKQIDRISKVEEENLAAKSNFEVSSGGNSPADFSGRPPIPEPTPAPEPTSTPEPTPEPKFREYKVRPGDSISRIARKHSVTSKAIAEASGLKDVNRIRVGQVLKIPTK